MLPLCALCFGHGKTAPTEQPCFACNGDGELPLDQLHFWRNQINILRSGLEEPDPRWPKNQPLPDLKPWLGPLPQVQFAVKIEHEYEEKLGDEIPKRFAPVTDWGMLYEMAPEWVRNEVLEPDSVRQEMLAKEGVSKEVQAISWGPGNFRWPANVSIPDVQPWLGSPRSVARAVKMEYECQEGLGLELVGIPKREMLIINWWKLYEMTPEPLRKEAI